MRTVVIIQARYGSTRLKGKTTMLLPVLGRCILAEVIRRAKLIRGVDDVAVAVPMRDEDILGPIVKGAGALLLVPECDENNLLMRYAIAAETLRANIIVRLTADCPLLDPDICSEVIALRAERGAHYATNSFLSRDGQPAANCEVFTMTALLSAAGSPWNEPHDLEHVGPAIKFVVGETAVLKKGRDLSVDTEEDYREVCRILAQQQMAEAA